MVQVKIQNTPRNVSIKGISPNAFGVGGARLTSASAMFAGLGYPVGLLLLITYITQQGTPAQFTGGPRPNARIT